MAIIDSQGTVVSIAGTAIGGVRGIADIGSGSANERDRTTLATTDFKSFAIGLQDGGTMSIDLLADDTDQGQRLAWAAYKNRTRSAVTVAYESGTTLSFYGYVSQFTLSANPDADVTGSIRVRIDGAISGFPDPS